jgi:class 3 adenylate cyclase
MTTAAALGGERRQLTVLFCDLVGSTALSQRLDPEDLRDIIHMFQACASSVVASYDGHVGGFHGDALLALFGYPRSHGDEPERAVRTAIEIVRAVNSLELPSRVKLQIRIGIATGIVVIGDGLAGELNPVGEAPNLAARLHALAEPNGIVVSEITRRLTGRVFEFTDLGSHALKGFLNPIPAWAVRGINRDEGRFEALRSPELTGLVGRRKELGLLLRHWRYVTEGTGRVVFVSGEAGIGKSRLLKELADGLTAERVIVLRFFGSPSYTNSALYPLIEAGSRLIAYSDDPAERHVALEDALRPLGDGWTEHLPWLADLLRARTEQLFEPRPRQQQKERTLVAILWWLKAMANKAPILLVVEDVHWLASDFRNAAGRGVIGTAKQRLAS